MKLQTRMGWALLAIIGLYSTIVSAQPPGQNREQGKNPERGQRQQGQQQRRGNFTWDRVSQRSDTNQDGKITRDEFQGPSQAFDRMDGNGDGTVTQAEFEETFGNYGRRENTPSTRTNEGEMASGYDPEMLMMLLDENKDGKLSREELLSFLEKLDDNQDQSLTLQELKRASGFANDHTLPAKTLLSDRLQRFESFPLLKPTPGDIAPLFELRDLEGQVVSLAELLKTKPVLIETGSYTCPVFRGRHQAIEKLHGEFANKIHLIVLYGREAHPQSNRFKDIKQPTRNEQRIQLAKNSAKELSIGVPVLVDDINDQVVKSYGDGRSGLPNSGYLIGQDGRVFHKLGWIHQDLMREPIRALLERGGRGGATPPPFPVGGKHPQDSGQARRVSRPNTVRVDSKDAKNAPIKVPATAKDEIVWNHDLPKAQSLAKEAGVPVLIEFHFDGCVFCEAMAKGPLKDEHVVALSRKYVCVKIDMTTEAGEALAEKHKIIESPTFVVLNPMGEFVLKHVNDAEANDVRDFLAEGLQLSQPPSSSKISPRSASVAPSTQPAAPQPVKVSLVEKHDGYEQYAWESTSHKEDWDGFVLKPEGVGPFPALISNHAGMSSADALVRNWGRVFVNRGFVVIGCDLGHQGNSRNWKGPGASDENVQRVLTALATLKTLRYVNQDKIAMYGHSMGGFCTLGVLSRDEAKDIRVAAISGSGIHSPEQQGGSRNLGRAAPTPEQAGRIRTPLLMIHSDDDRTVPVDCVQALRVILDENKVPNKLVLLEGVGHRGSAAGKPDNMAAILNFFEKHWDTKK